MSGFEIAGIILAGFPLLISAAEHYKRGFEPLIKWKRFRKDFIEFIDAVDTERILYSQTIERFLISADLPEEELRRFMTDQSYDGWHCEDITKLLQRRLGPSFAVYISTIQTMEGLLLELQTLLFLKDGEVEWVRANDWDYQLKRIHLSFSKRGERVVKSLESHNRKLRDLLDSSDKLQCLRATRRDTAWANIFHCIRKHANSLYNALKIGFFCECGTHVTSLRLEQRETSGWTSKFYMTLTVPKEPNMSIAIQQQVVTHIRNPSEAENISEIPPSHSSSSQKNQPEHVSNTSRDLESKPATILKVTSRPIFQAPQSVSSVRSDKGMLNMLRRSILKPTLSTSSSSPDKAKELSIQEQQSSLPPLRRTTKQKKSVRMESAGLPHHIPGHIQMASTSPSTASPTESERYPEIKELCKIIRSQSLNCHCLGYLNDGHRHHVVRPVSEAGQELPDGSYVSLDNLLKHPSPHHISRQQRYKLASIVASSFLQLQTTPWLAENLNKKNIYFYQKGSRVLLDRPYIRQYFKLSKLSSSLMRGPQVEAINQSVATRFDVRGNLNSLGILLLEICFGQPIEEQESRKQYLGPDGKAHEFTDYLTARDWAEMVSEEEPQLEQVIKCCILCFFEGKPDWENKKFTQAVWDSVVEPLDTIVKRWDVQGG